jgi:hypothetical protein
MMTLIHNNRQISNISNGVCTIFRFEMIILNKEKVCETLCLFGHLCFILVPEECKFRCLLALVTTLLLCIPTIERRVE